jgi:hypothetical protein
MKTILTIRSKQVNTSVLHQKSHSNVLPQKSFLFFYDSDSLLSYEKSVFASHRQPETMIKVFQDQMPEGSKFC